MRSATSILRTLFSPSEHYQLHTTREQRKRETHSLIHSAPSAGEELAGVEKLVNAWRDRSLESAIGNGGWKKHMPR
ncbi:hypothetical protein [Pseudomonas aeruginosa]|uniref:hypothetical protein n=1 Tax=Pseudomonas aeruginosa TaxID=287 RepID=UPI0039C3B835